MIRLCYGHRYGWLPGPVVRLKVARYLAPNALKALAGAQGLQGLTFRPVKVWQLRLCQAAPARQP